MPLSSHTISASWNRTGLSDGRLQFRVLGPASAVLVPWTSTGITEPAPKQYVREGVSWERFVDATVFWEDDLGRTAQELWPSGTGTPVAPAPGRTGLLDAPMRGLAQLLIGKLGGTCTLSRTVEGQYDPETDSSTSSQLQSWSDVEITPLQGFKVGEAYDTFRASGTMIEEGDFTTDIAAKHLEDRGIPMPEQGWTLTKDGVQYRIKGVALIGSGNKNALVTLHCGK